MEGSAVKQMGVGELIRRTINNLSDLIDMQAVLAALEIRENMLSLFRGGGILIIGLVNLFLMAIALMIAVIFALSLVMPGWLASLIVAAFFFIVGGVLIWIGRSRLQIQPLGRTRETLKEDVEWAKRRLMSNARLRS